LFSVFAEEMELIEVFPGACFVGIPVAEHLGEVTARHEKRRQGPALTAESALALVDRFFRITLACRNYTEGDVGLSKTHRCAFSAVEVGAGLKPAAVPATPLDKAFG
jgi:hypothetical protein